MTRHVFFKVSALVSALALVIGFTACGNGSTTTKNSEAKLTGITIAGAAVTPLPLPIASAVWDQDGPLADLADDQTAEVILGKDVDTNVPVAVTFSASSGASVAFGRASNLAKPQASGAGGSFVPASANYSLIKNQFFYVRVTAEGGAVNYYRFHITQIESVTTISSLAIGSKILTSFSNTNNSSTDSYTGISSPASANLSITGATNVQVVAVSANTTAVIQYALVKKGVTAAPSFEAANTFTFEDEDLLYVKVTTDDGKDSRYYKFQIILGRDATLNDISFSGVLSGNPFSVNPETIGSALDSVAAFDELEEDDNETVGKMQFEIRQPLDGFTVKGVANDDGATVTISKNGISFSPNEGKMAFSEGDFLYVKTVSGNGAITQYYKIKMILKRSAIIIYGSPPTWSASNPDAIWDNTEWMPVNRLNKTEGASGYNAMAANERTHGQVKLLWDEDGIWVYAQVWEKNITAAAATSDHHMASSVELFINEAYSAGVKTGAVTGSATNGGQYRVGANGEASGAPDAAVTAMRTLNHYSATKFSGQASPQGTDSSLTSGYKVIFHAPWRFPNLYPIKDEKEISMELQINATGSDSRRGGVLNWNNENSNSYNSLKDYGEAALYLGNSEFKAFPPIITKQPEGQNLMQGEVIKEISVTAESIDEGGLSYKWYSNTTDSYTGGAVIASAAGPAYTPAVTAVGKYYYWVEVINTKASNNTSKSANSNRVRIYIKDPAVSIPDWVLEFDPPLRNAEAVNNNTQMITIKLDKYASDGVTVTEEFDVTQYATMSVAVKVYNKDGVTERTLTGSEYSICTYLWRNAENAELNSADYNVGRPDKPFLNRTIPAAVLTAGGLKTLIIQSGDSFNASGSNALNLGYMEVYKVSFYPAE